MLLSRKPGVKAELLLDGRDEASGHLSASTSEKGALLLQLLVAVIRSLVRVKGNKFPLLKAAVDH